MGYLVKFVHSTALSKMAKEKLKWEPLLAPVRKKYITNPSGLTAEKSRTELWIEPDDVDTGPVVADKNLSSNQSPVDLTEDLSATLEPTGAHYLIVGFDIEFISPPPLTTKEQTEIQPIKVLSYQFCAATNGGIEWEGICLPDGDERISLAEFMLFVIATGCRTHGLTQLPSKIFLVGHSNNLKLPLFSDFSKFSTRLSVIQRTFATGPASIGIDLICCYGSILNLDVQVRDTLLLVSQASKRLKDVGEMVGVKEVQLTEDPSDYLDAIANLDQVRSNDWNRFKRYALNDPAICVRYLQRIIRITEEATGTFYVPITLASIGIKLLQTDWKTRQRDENDILGNEAFTSQVYDSRFGHYTTKTVVVRKELFNIYEQLITECYHGGRGEQFWFGPGYEAVWSDYDLSGAYPTAMSYIGIPKWDELVHSYELADYKLNALGFALVDFEFPDDVRFPTLPVRAEDGLIFPRKGRSYCSAPEIHLAVRLKATLKIVTGVVIPQDITKPVFYGFIESCVAKREAAGEGTFEGSFWKEISNTLYGKTAQGLKEKRIYDLKDQETKQMPRSDITNAAFAAYITSFTRAVLGESINAIPRNRTVFSCTTDGFITDASQSEMDHINKKRLFNLVFGGLRGDISGSDTVMKKKHEVRRPLGWRGKGQATLLAGTNPDVKRIVLAKASIYTVPEMETVFAQNRFIVDLFFDRQSDTRIHEIGGTSIRDLVKYGDDPHKKFKSKKLNMEYDWKRRPSAICTTNFKNHIAFTTDPWDTVDQYNRVQKVWDAYFKDELKCVKSVTDFDKWTAYLRSRTVSEHEVSKNLSTTGDAELIRLRQMLCRAFKQGRAGVSFNHKVTNERFAQHLQSVGISCGVPDVQNGKNEIKNPFIPHRCIPSDTVDKALLELKKLLPSLDIDELLYPVATDNQIIDLRNLPSNYFLDMAAGMHSRGSKRLTIPSQSRQGFIEKIERKNEPKFHESEFVDVEDDDEVNN